MKKYMTVLSIVFGIFCFIYVLVYQYVYQFLPLENLLWATFVALPIYFAGAGAKKEQFPLYFVSMLVGLVWAYIYLKPIEWLIGAGWPVAFTMALVVGVVVIIMCYIHLVPLANTWLGVVPIMFGAVSTTFATGGKDPLSLGITLTGGMLLAMASVEVTNLIVKPAKQE